MKHRLIVPAILIALTLWGLLSLGFWQLDRAEEKRSIEAAVVLARSQPAQLINQADDLLDKEYYQVLLRGSYDNNKQFIYDNQIVKSNAGYFVLTPFVLAGSSSVILINRGFMPWHGQRNKIADINLDEHVTTIKVTLIKPKQRLKLKQQNIKPNFPLLIQSLDLSQLSALSGYDILPILGQLDAEEKHGFYRQWQPFYGSVDKHLGYAFQWFAMAFVLFLIAIRLFIKYKNKP